MKFRKKPIVIEAERFYIGENPNGIGDVLPFQPDAQYRKESPLLAREIKTLEGWLTVRHGNWIVKGVKGEFYPMRDDIFRATYEEV